MRTSTLALFLGLAFLAIYVTPTMSAPAPQCEDSNEEEDDCEENSSEGDDEEDDCEEDSSEGDDEEDDCEEDEGEEEEDDCESGSEEEGGEGGSGDLLDLTVFLDVDLSGLEELLNALLDIILGMAEAGNNTCDMSEMMEEMESIIVDLLVYINLLGIELRIQLLIVLGPLLQAVSELLQSLLGGVLDSLGSLLSSIINLVLEILSILNLNLDLEVAVRLGNVLKLNILALLNLG